MDVRPRYRVGDQVTLARCPDVGTVVDIRQGVVSVFYRVDWDAVPEDHLYYSEDQLIPWEEKGDAGFFQVG